jgi:hypothetical protein
MQLRNGKITDVSSPYIRDYCKVQTQLLANITNAKVSGAGVLTLSFLESIYQLFRHTNTELPAQNIAEFYTYIVTLYERSFTMMGQLTEKTYSPVYRPKTKKQMELFVRTLLEIDRTQEYLTRLIKEHQVKMFEYGAAMCNNKNWSGGKASLYITMLSKCLSHIYRVEHDELFYKVYEFGSGEYTDIEYFNYYFGENYYKPENTEYDEFLKTTKNYFVIPQ